MGTGQLLGQSAKMLVAVTWRWNTISSRLSDMETGISSSGVGQPIQPVCFNFVFSELVKNSVQPPLTNQSSWY